MQQQIAKERSREVAQDEEKICHRQRENEPVGQSEEPSSCGDQVSVL